MCYQYLKTFPYVMLNGLKITWLNEFLPPVMLSLSDNDTDLPYIYFKSNKNISQSKNLIMFMKGTTQGL